MFYLFFTVKDIFDFQVLLTGGYMNIFMTLVKAVENIQYTN